MNKRVRDSFAALGLGVLVLAGTAHADSPIQYNLCASSNNTAYLVLFTGDPDLQVTSVAMTDNTTASCAEGGSFGVLTAVAAGGTTMLAEPKRTDIISGLMVNAPLINCIGNGFIFNPSGAGGFGILTLPNSHRVSYNPSASDCQANVPIPGDLACEPAGDIFTTSTGGVPQAAQIMGLNRTVGFCGINNGKTWVFPNPSAAPVISDPITGEVGSQNALPAIVTPTATVVSTLNAGSVQGGAGSTVGVPITLTVAPGTVVATLQFNLTVVPAAGAPGLTVPVAFLPAAGLTVPSLNQVEGTTTALVGWLSNFASPLTGTVQLGILNVPVPAGAAAGGRYDVQVLNPSATSDGVRDLTVDGGPGGVTIAQVIPTFTLTATSTPTYSPTPTASRTATPSRTLTHTPTASPKPSVTHARTATATSSPTLTRTPTASPTRTFTRTPTATSTVTTTRTHTATLSPTRTQTPTHTVTPSMTRTPTNTPTPTPSPTEAVTPTTTACANLVPVVEPVVSPTDLLEQTIYFSGVRQAGSSWVSISSEAGSVVAQVYGQGTVPLVPGTTNHIEVCQENTICSFHCVTVDMNGNPLTIVQVSTPATATETPTPTSTPTPSSTATGSPTRTGSPSPTPTPTEPVSLCVGDCTGGGTVQIDDVIKLVNIALGSLPPDACFNGNPGGGEVTIDMLIVAVNNALSGCPKAAGDAPTITRTATRTPTETRTPTLTRTVTPTRTPTPAGIMFCPNLGGGVAIPDGDPTGGVWISFVVSASGSIEALRVHLDIEHPFVGDLYARLEHIDTGTGVWLLYGPGRQTSAFGCPGQDVSCVFDDLAQVLADNMCNATPPAISGHVLPTGFLSNFLGEDPGGTWRLWLWDDEPDDNGRLTRWCLEME